MIAALRDDDTFVKREGAWLFAERTGQRVVPLPQVYQDGVGVVGIF